MSFTFRCPSPLCPYSFAASVPSPSLCLFLLPHCVCFYSLTASVSTPSLHLSLLLHRVYPCPLHVSVPSPLSTSSLHLSLRHLVLELELVGRVDLRHDDHLWCDREPRPAVALTGQESRHVQRLARAAPTPHQERADHRLHLGDLLHLVLVQPAERAKGRCANWNSNPRLTEPSAGRHWLGSYFLFEIWHSARRRKSRLERVATVVMVQLGFIWESVSFLFCEHLTYYGYLHDNTRNSR